MVLGFRTITEFLQFLWPKTFWEWMVLLLVVAVALFILWRGFFGILESDKIYQYYHYYEDRTEQWKIEHQEEREEWLSSFQRCSKCGKLTQTRELSDVYVKDYFKPLRGFVPNLLWSLGIRPTKVYCKKCIENDQGRERQAFTGLDGREKRIGVFAW